MDYINSNKEIKTNNSNTDDMLNVYSFFLWEITDQLYFYYIKSFWVKSIYLENSYKIFIFMCIVFEGLSPVVSVMICILCSLNHTKDLSSYTRLQCRKTRYRFIWPATSILYISHTICSIVSKGDIRIFVFLC